jgi:MFS family permease
MGTRRVRRPLTATGVFWTYWSAATVSSVGSAVSAVALPLVAVSVLRASAFEVGVLAAASYVAWLVIGLPAGVLVARLPLRGTQVATDLVRAAALASVPVAWWLDALTLAHLVLVALVTSFATVLFEVGSLTLLPTIVPREQLQSRNSLTSGTHATTQLAGPSLGGLFVQLVGAVPTLLVDTVSYLASAVLVHRLPEREPVLAPTVTPPRTLIREGWRYVTRHPLMGPSMWDATLINFACGGLMALTPLYLVRVLGAEPGLVGLLIASEGVGALVGAALTPRIARRLGTARALVLSALAAAVLALLMPLGSGSVGMVAFAVGNAGFAGGVVVSSVLMRTYRQTETPPELLSRVVATVRFVSWGAIPVGSLAAGAAAAGLGARPALSLVCAATFLPLVVLLASPIRHLRDLDDLEVDVARERGALDDLHPAASGG